MQKCHDLAKDLTFFRDKVNVNQTFVFSTVNKQSTNTIEMSSEEPGEKLWTICSWLTSAAEGGVYIL